MRWQERERGKGITRTPKEGKDEEMEPGDTWVYPYMPSSQGWVKVSLGKWRADLRKSLEQTSQWRVVEGCGSPQSGCPWHVPTLPIPLAGWQP